MVASQRVAAELATNDVFGGRREQLPLARGVTLNNIEDEKTNIGDGLLPDGSRPIPRQVFLLAESHAMTVVGSPEGPQFGALGSPLK